VSCSLLVNGSYREYSTAASDELFRELTRQGHLGAMSLSMETHPEPETGWPERKTVDRHCANLSCTVRTKKWMECPRCHQVQYCSKKCQKAHWKAQHKNACFDVTDPNDPKNPIGRPQRHTLYHADSGPPKSPYYK